MSFTDASANASNNDISQSISSQLLRPAPVYYSPLTALSPIPGANAIPGVVTPNVDVPSGPLNPSAPKQATALRNLFNNADVTTALQQLHPSDQHALVQLNQQRVANGQNPLTRDQMVNAAQTIQTHLPATPAPQPNPFLPTNILKNAARDVTLIGQNIPHIPGQLFNEVKAIGGIGEQLSQAHSVADYMHLPGVRLIPGANTIANLTSGRAGIQQEFEHPVLSLLDVLPAAGAKVFSPGAEELANAARLSEAAGETVAPLNRSFVNVLGDTPPGQVIGKVADVGKEAIGNSRVGQFVDRAVGQNARGTAMTESLFSAQLRDMLDPNGSIAYPGQIDVEVARAGKQLSNDFRSIPEQRQAELFNAVTNPAAPGNPLDQITDLTDPERGMLQRYGEFQNRILQYHLDAGTLQRIDGEIYDSATAAKINAATTPEQRAALLRDSPPARFIPKLREAANEQLKVFSASDNNIAQVTQAINEGTISQFPHLRDPLTAIQDDVARTWQTLRDEGYDPVFVHSVPPSRVSVSQFPHVLDYIPTKPSQIIKRGMDLSPGAQNFSIALDHQTLELLNQRMSAEYIDHIGQTFARTADDVREELTPTAQRMAARDPRFDVAGHLDKLVRARYTGYNPDDLLAGNYTDPFSAIKNEAGQQLYLPRAVTDTVAKLRTPVSNGFTTFMDPIMKTFRTAVLPFSVRWHFNNLFGNAMMLMGQAGPGVFMYAKNASELMRAGETTLASGERVAIPEFLRLQKGSSTALQREADMARPLAELAGGTTAGRMMMAIEDAGVPAAGAVADATAPAIGAVAKAGQVLTNVAQKSYRFQSFIDDSMRAMAYLHGYDKALTSGMTEEAATAAGEALARKSMMTWGDMTPFERSVMRYAFPFYGFARHIIGYSMKYPIDHPFRSGILSSFANAEWQDHQNDGMPMKLMNGFFFGGTDENGNRKQFNLGGMNPFRDVGSYFTLAGLVGQSNPIVKTLMEQMGIDTQTGAPELYPELQYDPETGKLAVKPQDPITRLIANTIPQSQILTGLASRGSEFRQLMQQNPDAAMRMIRSQLGLPVLYRTINVPQEQAKSEIAREKSQTDAFNNALKTGNYTEAQQYPQLQPVLSNLARQQQAGALTAYEPSANRPNISPLQLAQAALIRANDPRFSAQQLTTTGGQ